MSQSQENLRADGRRDKQTLFYRTLPAEASDPTTSLQQVTGGNTPNLVLKRMLRYFLNIPQLKKIYNFKNEIRLQNLYKKENFKPEIKPMIENLQDELYQLENKQTKGAKLRANMRSWRAKNASKLSSKYLKERI